MITDDKSANSTTLRAQKLRVALRQTLASEVHSVNYALLPNP